MARRTLTRLIAIALAAVALSVSASAASVTKSVSWTNPSDGLMYTATVTNSNSTKTQSIEVNGTRVSAYKGVTLTAGGRSYDISFTNDIWDGSPYSSYLDQAGALAEICRTYSETINFKKTFTFTTNYAGTYCAITDGYGFIGSYYVTKNTASSSVTVESGSFTFAPCGCANVITGIIDVNFL